MTAHDSDHDSGLHGGWLVPIKRDADGSTLLICFIDSQIGTRADGWALYCPTCRATVTGVLPGTEGLQDLDGLPDDLCDALLRQEWRLAQAHAAAQCAQPEQVALSRSR